MDGTDWLRSPALLAAAAGFGALWGSFFNVCIARVPKGQSIVRPASHCFSCGTPVRAIDNVPILSYLLLRGRCRSCGAKFSPRYLLVELLTAALSALIFWQVVAAAPAEVTLAVRAARYAVYFAFAGVMVVLSFIDLDTMTLPDVITLPSIPIFFAAGFAVHEAGWIDRAIGIAAGYLVIRIISDGYYYITGREGLGLGDAKLLAVMGALLGWKALPIVIFLGSFIGVLIGIPLMLIARRQGGDAPPPEPIPGQGAATGDGGDEETPARFRHVPLPFGPFLALSALVFLLYREPLWGWLSNRLLG